MLMNDTLSFGVAGNYDLFIHSPKLTYLIVTRMFVIRLARNLGDKKSPRSFVSGSATFQFSTIVDVLISQSDCRMFNVDAVLFLGTSVDNKRFSITCSKSSTL